MIAEEYVLTAAHCCDGANFIQVVMGAHNVREDEDTQVKSMSKDFDVHEEWNPNQLTNDICWVHINAVEFSRFILINHLFSIKNISFFR